MHPLLATLDPDTTPLFFDASAFKNTSCQRKYAYKVVQGLRSVRHNPIFERGKALHKYAELREKGVPDLEALSVATTWPGLDDPGLVMSACSQYGKMRLDSPARDGQTILVEHQFLVKYGTRVCAGQKFALFLTGRVDRINFTTAGFLEIIDFKSSQSWKFEDIVARYIHDVQLDFYPWVLNKYAYEIFKDINLANAAHYGKLGTRIVAIMIGGKTTPRWEVDALKIPTKEEMEDFGRLLETNIEQLVKIHCDMAEDKDYLPIRNGRFNNSCPSCDMAGLCFARDDHEKGSIMRGLEKKVWDPTTW